MRRRRCLICKDLVGGGFWPVFEDGICCPELDPRFEQAMWSSVTASAPTPLGRIAGRSRCYSAVIFYCVGTMSGFFQVPLMTSGAGI